MANFINSNENFISMFRRLEGNRKIPLRVKIDFMKRQNTQLACSRKGYRRMAKVLNQIFSKKRKIIKKLMDRKEKLEVTSLKKE